MTRSLRLSLAAVIFAAACSRPGRDVNAFRWTAELPAGSVVHIRDGAGSVDVRTATGSAAIVKGSRSWRRGRARDVQFVVNQIGKDYYVCAMWRNSGGCGDSDYRGRSLNTFLSMFSLFHRSSDASADFTIELPPSVRIDARTSIGSVTIDGATAGVYAKTSNGSVTATNVAGPLVLGTSNGNVRLSASSLAPTDSVLLNTKNGSITAELPADVDGAFDLRTTNGSVRSDLPLTPTSQHGISRRLTGQIGASNRAVRMRTSNGAVVVTTRPAPAAQ